MHDFSATDLKTPDGDKMTSALRCQMQVNVLKIFGNSAALHLSRKRKCLQAARSGLLLIAILACFSTLLFAKAQWMELNIGPFRVATDGDLARARQTLANLEQLRWILGGMLENKDLQATWPFRILITETAPAGISSFQLAHGQYVVAVRPGSEPSFVEVARLFVEANTPRLPAEVDSGVSRLFYEMSARGSQVTWAKKPANPDVAWARMQLFATKPEYAGRFSVFLNNLRGGSLLSVAEANAFGKPSSALEQEIAGYFAAGVAPAVTTSARPLDPKRDFGEHSLNQALAGVFLGDAWLTADRTKAEEAYKAAGNADLEALAQEGFALLAVAEKDDPQQYLEGAMAAGTKSAWVFAEAAESQNPAEASTLLMKARELNPRWWLPPAKLAGLTQDAHQKEQFLQEACQKDPRSAELWQQLAELQSHQGKGRLAQNSWIRAEDAAATPAERKAIHEKRLSLENERLDAQENAKRQEAASAKAEEDRLRNDQLARIRQAEKKADDANSSGTNEPKGEVLQWWKAGERPVEADLLKVDCLGEQVRLVLKSDAGKPLSLLVADAAKVHKEGPDAGFPCGALAAPRKVSITYKVRADKQLGTAGDVISVRFE